MTEPDISALLARVEGAEGADREIDGDLWLALEHDTAWAKVGWKGYVYAGSRFTKPEKAAWIRRSASHQSPEFTASLDAALALCERVLPGWAVEVCRYGVPNDARATVWREGLRGEFSATAKSATPALALLAAMLKALIAQAARAAPEPPWEPGAKTNAKRKGWFAFFEGRGREDCPFPPARRDLQDGYREGWDAAAAGQMKA